MFKSIQSSFTALAGVGVLSVVAALLVQVMLAGQQTQLTVEDRTRTLIEGMIEQRVSALSQLQASRIQAQLQLPLLIAADVARVNALSGTTGRDGQPVVNLTRDELVNLARKTLEENTQLANMYIAWEPNGVLANDPLHLDEPGTIDGRFLALLFRDERTVKIEPLPGVDDSQLLPTGVRANEYYLCARDTLKPCAIDPAPYETNGVTEMLASFSAPIIIDGKFHGIVGSDLGVDFIQKLLSDANVELYQGAGNIALISTQGSLAAYTKDPSQIGKPSASLFDDQDISRLAQASQQTPLYRIDRAQGDIVMYVPFSFPGTSARWTLRLELPMAVVMQDLEDLLADLDTEHQSGLLRMLLIGLVIAAVALGVIWVASTRITDPLRRLGRMLNEIVRGEGDLTQRLRIDSRNEIGQIAQGFNEFLSRLQNMIGNVIGSVDKVSDSAKTTAAIAQNTDQGVRRQLAEIEQVAAAVHQMAATAQDVASNATRAAEAAHNADLAATQGKQTVTATGDSISQLANEMSRAVDLVQTLARDSEHIGLILVTIRSIAEQTNLLALNAAIEAARAGESGRGFAVVADEVRNLAKKTQQATSEIQNMIEQLQNGTNSVVAVIENSQNRTQKSVEQASAASLALLSITEAVSQINDMNNQIASAAEEQSAVAEEINRNVVNIGQVANEVASGADEASQASAVMTQLAEEQRRLINQFKV